MRALSTNIKTLLALDNINFFYLVTIGPYTKADGSTTTTYDTTISDGITINGQTYSGNNFLVSVDPPRLSTVVDKGTYKVSYTDPQFLWRGILEKGFSGVPVKIQVGLFNTTEGALGGASPGEPLKQIADIITMYSGWVDTPAYGVDLNGEVVVSFECTSPMGPLGLIRSIMTSKDSLRAFSTTDTAYDQVLVGSKGIDLYWGKRRQT